MLPSLILLACLSTSALAQTPTLLPEYMLGEYVLETSEGFDDYMWQLGVNWFTRKVRDQIFVIRLIHSSDKSWSSVLSSTNMRQIRSLHL